MYVGLCQTCLKHAELHYFIFATSKNLICIHASTLYTKVQLFSRKLYSLEISTPGAPRTFSNVLSSDLVKLGTWQDESFHFPCPRVIFLRS